jgi:hypothetical protein
MIAKHLERVLAAAHVVCGPHKDLAAVNNAHVDLAKALAEADPLGVYKQTAPEVPTSAPHEPYVSLRDSPRLSRAIGGPDSTMHD